MEPIHWQLFLLTHKRNRDNDSAAMNRFSCNRAVVRKISFRHLMAFVLFGQIEIRCTKVGEWTAEFSMCSELVGSCSPPADLNSVEYSCDQGRDVGEWSPSDFLNTQCWLYFLLPVKWNKSINSSPSGRWLVLLELARRGGLKLLWDLNCIFSARGQMAETHSRSAFKSIQRQLLLPTNLLFFYPPPPPVV